MLLALAGRGRPTKEFGVPLKATLRPKEVLKATKQKRKAPHVRHAVPPKRRKSGSNQDKSHPVFDKARVNDYIPDSAEVIENSSLENDLEKSAKSRHFATQTDVSNHELSYKVVNKDGMSYDGNTLQRICGGSGTSNLWLVKLLPCSPSSLAFIHFPPSIPGSRRW